MLRPERAPISATSCLVAILGMERTYFGFVGPALACASVPTAVVEATLIAAVATRAATLAVAAAIVAVGAASASRL